MIIRLDKTQDILNTVIIRTVRVHLARFNRVVLVSHLSHEVNRGFQTAVDTHMNVSCRGEYFM